MVDVGELWKGFKVARSLSEKGEVSRQIAAESGLTQGTVRALQEGWERFREDTLRQETETVKEERAFEVGLEEMVSDVSLGS